MTGPLVPLIFVKHIIQILENRPTIPTHHTLIVMSNFPQPAFLHLHSTQLPRSKRIRQFSAHEQCLLQSDLVIRIIQTPVADSKRYLREPGACSRGAMLSCVSVGEREDFGCDERELVVVVGDVLGRFPLIVAEVAGRPVLYTQCFQFGKLACRCLGG